VLVDAGKRTREARAQRVLRTRPNARASRVPTNAHLNYKTERIIDIFLIFF